MDKNQNADDAQQAEQKRDAMLLRLLKTPPQPRQQRDRDDCATQKKNATGETA